MSDNIKRPFSDVFPVARHIADTLAPFCQRIEMAGSLRRERPFIGDIELVAIPHYQTDLTGQTRPDIPTELDRFLATKLGNKLSKNGAKYKSFAYGKLKVDLFLTVPANWGNIFTIRTGSGDFSKWLVRSVGWGGAMPLGMRQKDGCLWRGAERIDCYEESEFFDALGIPFIPLDMRDDEEWQMAVFAARSE